MVNMVNEKVPKSSGKFYCEKCDFVTSRNSQYIRHLNTAKHKMITKGKYLVPKSSEFFCECGKSYKYHSGLSRHKNSSTSKENDVIEEPIESTKKISDKVEFCKEIFPFIKDMILEIMPKMQPTTINTTNNHNQIYNINTFLNEQCKDAMNMSDFIESMQLSIQDMERIGSEGQTNGMANILIDKLNRMDVFQRPMHCSDAKKETIYIKDQDKWEIEKKDRPKLKHALEKISNKSVKCLHDVSHTENFEKTFVEVLKEPIENNRIISKVAKNIVLNEGNK